MKKKKLNLEATADDYLTSTMTVLFHGPPTRGPVMNFCESEAPGSRKKKNLGQRLLCLHRLTCTSRSSLAPAVLYTAWIMQRSASRAPLRPIGGEL